VTLGRVLLALLCSNRWVSFHFPLPGIHRGLQTLAPILYRRPRVSRIATLTTVSSAVTGSHLILHHMVICLFPGNLLTILEIFFILCATYSSFIILGKISPYLYYAVDHPRTTCVHMNMCGNSKWTNDITFAFDEPYTMGKKKQ